MGRTPARRTATPKGDWRIALAASTYYPEITGPMREDARRRARENGARIVVEAETSGSYDLPLVAQRLARRKDVDAVVALGAIIEGETEHDEAIAHAIFYALSQVSMEEGKPVGLGVTGPGQTERQAHARIDRAGAAVDAVVKTLQTLAALRDR